MAAIKELLLLSVVAFFFGLALGWQSVQQHLAISAELLLFASALIGVGYCYTRRKAIAKLIEDDE